MEACGNNNLLNSFIKGLQDIKLPTFYTNKSIEPIRRQNINVSEQLRRDYKKSLVEIRKAADEFAK